jgi:cystathionine beta-lyase/cystathionine gamma-synthase
MNNGADAFDLASLITAHDEGNFAEAVVPPIFQTSLFTFSDYDDMISSYRGEKVRPIYTRGLNPTVRMFEESPRPFCPSSSRAIASLRSSTSIPMPSACSERS